MRRRRSHSCRVRSQPVQAAAAQRRSERREAAAPCAPAQAASPLEGWARVGGRSREANAQAAAQRLKGAPVNWNLKEALASSAVVPKYVTCAENHGTTKTATRQLQRQQRQDEGTAIPIAIANGGTIIADAYSAA